MSTPAPFEFPFSGAPRIDELCKAAGVPVKTVTEGTTWFSTIVDTPENIRVSYVLHGRTTYNDPAFGGKDFSRRVRIEFRWRSPRTTPLDGCARCLVAESIAPYAARGEHRLSVDSRKFAVAYRAALEQRAGEEPSTEVELLLSDIRKKLSQVSAGPASPYNQGYTAALGEVLEMARRLPRAARRAH